MSHVASLRQVRRRIRSVENTKKITRAMEMVAAAKLRRFQDLLEAAHAYTEKLEEMANRLLGELPPGYHHPFLEKPDSAASSEKIALVIFTSDTGLCGTYNSEVESGAKSWIRENPARKIRFVFVGKHGAGAFHGKEGEAPALFSDLRVGRVDEILEGLKKSLETAFLNSEVGEVWAGYTRMESLSRYHPLQQRILPIPSKAVEKKEGGSFLIEPGPKQVLDRLIPILFETRLRFILYHALLTEQIARMSAMRQATQNAEDMIDELTLLRNKARQASITKEIIEVVSGSRALRRG